MEVLFAIIFIAAVVWFWMDGLWVRERALRAGADACARLQVQFLDETVALAGLGLARDEGRLRLRRRYVFEFSSDGGDRRQGRVLLLGHRLLAVQLDQDEGATILPFPSRPGEP